MLSVGMSGRGCRVRSGTGVFFFIDNGNMGRAGVDGRFRSVVRSESVTPMVKYDVGTFEAVLFLTRDFANFTGVLVGERRRVMLAVLTDESMPTKSS